MSDWTDDYNRDASIYPSIEELKLEAEFVLNEIELLGIISQVDGFEPFGYMDERKNKADWCRYLGILSAILSDYVRRIQLPRVRIVHPDELRSSGYTPFDP